MRRIMPASDSVLAGGSRQSREGLMPTLPIDDMERELRALHWPNAACCGRDLEEREGKRVEVLVSSR